MLFQVVRFEPKDFRQRRPDGNGGWVWSLLGETRRVLYRLPDVIAAIRRSETIYQSRARRTRTPSVDHGLTTTTNPGGASKWRAEYSEALRGADVVIIGDNDEAGRKHVAQVASALHGMMRRIRVLDLAKVWPECPAKGDVSAWLVAGHTGAELETLAGTLPDWKPAQQDTHETAGRPLTAAEFLRLDLPPRQRIIAPWLSDKGLVMVYSPRGVGKTLFGLTCAYAIAIGAGFLGFSIETPRKVLYLDGEMPAQTMQERLAAIVGGFDVQPPTNDHFRILLSDLTEFGLPDLATAEGQAWIDARVGDAEVISSTISRRSPDRAKRTRPKAGALSRIGRCASAELGGR